MGCTNTKVLPQEDQVKKQSHETLSRRRGSAQKKKIAKSTQRLEELGTKAEKSTGEILTELIEDGRLKNPKVAKGGLAFHVGSTIPEQAKPKHLARLESTGPGAGELDGSAHDQKLEDKLLMQQYDAERRRMFKVAEMKARLNEKRNNDMYM